MITTPYLVQRIFHVGSTGNLDERCRWDYMGSAEFEMGALSRTVWTMRRFDQDEGLVHGEVASGETRLFFLGPVEQHPVAARLLGEELGHVENRYGFRKERTHMKRSLGLEVASGRRRPVDGWLSILQSREAHQVLPGEEAPFFLSRTESFLNDFTEALRSKRV